MPDALAWKRRSIYQVLTDRFAVTDHGNDGPLCHGKMTNYCGGTWQGIISKLDYIQGMGFDAIWISPINKNIEENTHYGQAYHGYWQDDIYSVNPHFGTAQDLLALSNALHARGMFLMVDIIVNHMGPTSPLDFSRYTPFNNASYYHTKTFITDYDNQTNVEQGWLGDSHVSLPDLNTENPTVVRTFYAWISALVQKFQIDGLRIDTVKHVRKNFWPGFVKAAGVWCVGEVLSGDPCYLGSYQPYIGGLLDYATYYPLKRAFKSGSGSMYEIANLMTPEYRAKFADMQQLATFMESHDMPRFPHDTNSDLTVIKNALAWTLLTDGIPIVYYGQEQSFSGGDEPGCRELMWTSGYKVTRLYQYIAVLNRIRKLSWNAGFSTNLTRALYTDTHIAVTQKGPLLMVLSNEGSHSKQRMVYAPTVFSTGTVLVDILTSQSVVVRPSVRIMVVAGQPHIYLPHSLASRICSNIIAPPQSPITKFLSMFPFPYSKRAPGSTQTSWSSGIPANTRNRMRSPTGGYSSGAILHPTPSSLNSEYSIFATTTSSRPVSTGGSSTNPSLDMLWESHPFRYSRPTPSSAERKMFLPLPNTTTGKPVTTRVDGERENLKIGNPPEGPA